MALKDFWKNNPVNNGSGPGNGTAAGGQKPDGDKIARMLSSILIPVVVALVLVRVLAKSRRFLWTRIRLLRLIMKSAFPAVLVFTNVHSVQYLISLIAPSATEGRLLFDKGSMHIYALKSFSSL